MATLDNAHALVIGIAEYENISRLPPAVLKDAQDIHDLLLDPQRCGYPAANVRLLKDGQATRDALVAALGKLATATSAASTVFIFLSGHGCQSSSGDYLLPVDARLSDVEGSAISGAEFTALLRAIPANRLVVMLDCCHAGGIGEAKDAMAPEIKAGLSDRCLESLKAGIGRVILASSRSSERSYILAGASNSLFAHHLLAGLRGGAPGSGGVIRIFDLFHYLQPLVTQDHPKQHPIFKAELEENFPIARYLGGQLPAAAAPASVQDGFQYDVFLSYRQTDPEKTWVRKTLLPRLKQAGLRVCVDFESFRLGAHLIKEMERAVERSRYTLGVLTPAYLQSGFTELESILSRHLGVEKKQRRFLAILREPCQPGLDLRSRLWLPMTDDSEFETDVVRLIEELREPA